MRLTKEIREQIKESAIHKAFDTRDKAHEKATVALADALYKHEYGAAEKIARKLPQGFCETSNRIRIDAAGFSYRSTYDGKKSDRLTMSKSRPVPACSGRHIKVGGAHPLNDQAQAVAEEYQAIQRDKEAMVAKLNTLLCSVTTAPKLIEAWPEVERFLPSTTTKPNALVPVGLVPQLNAALGIKSTRRATT